jgi:hypothetical protein
MCRSRVNAKPFSVMLGAEGLNRLDWHSARKQNVRQQQATRPPESKRSIRLSLDLKAFLVDGAMMPATEQGEI